MLFFNIWTCPWNLHLYYRQCLLKNLIQCNCCCNIIFGVHNPRNTKNVMVAMVQCVLMSIVLLFGPRWNHQTLHQSQPATMMPKSDSKSWFVCFFDLSLFRRPWCFCQSENVALHLYTLKQRSILLPRSRSLPRPLIGTYQGSIIIKQRKSHQSFSGLANWIDEHKDGLLTEMNTLNHPPKLCFPGVAMDPWLVMKSWQAGVKRRNEVSPEPHKGSEIETESL